MGGSDENYPGVIRPSNIQGVLRAGGDKFPTPGHSRRALNVINKNIIGIHRYPSAVHKRGVLTEKNAISNKKPDVPVHRPITRKFAAQMACEQQLPYIKDAEIEMEDIDGEEPVVDIDSSDKKNPLAFVEYIDDIYAYFKKT
ncbi:Cyclin-B2-4 [Forsythia ovata]|uniref:Cyclin-B2-4 n=1 Tax=Forsythia ovata TaxID=205694 RepID=A0ABD1UDK0_9LAMI